MQKILITGMNGTVAPALAAGAPKNTVEIFSWDRAAVPPEDHERGTQFLSTLQPDGIIHCAMGPPDWADWLAKQSSAQRIRYLYVSSVSVFSNQCRGPFTIHSKPDAEDDYGRYKAECEHRVATENSDAIIARLGWQIGSAPGSNNMIDFFTTRQREEGVVHASQHWRPSCCFLEDTAQALWALYRDPTAKGIYQLEGNPGLSFYDIAKKLNRLHKNAWHINAIEEPDWDNRMEDTRIEVTPITKHLG